MFGFRRNKIKETERRIRANDHEYNAQFNYANNFIKTSKYNIFTFLPLNLCEQFRRLANAYFLCLFILQCIPVLSSLSPLTTAIPLILVLTVTAFKDAIDDFQRHQSDKQVNNRLSRVLRNEKLVEERWHRVQVGDIIQISNDHFVAADLLLLSTSEPNGLCYIETAELDGETNLKCRQVLPETAVLLDDIRKLSNFHGEIRCEAPNNSLTKFEGTLIWNNQSYSLDNDKMLLRGCILRNTKWAFGVVVFAGRDTKLMKNSGKTTLKRTSLDGLLNTLIRGIVCVLLILCIVCAVACGVWEMITGQHFRIYLPWDSEAVSDWTRVKSGAAKIATFTFFSYLIVLNTLVPISLYVSVEIIRVFHSLYINWDEKMYDPNSDTPAKARTTTLNEELGQIEYIFTDKTGTLTQNIMTFNKCSINGQLYGEIYDEYTGEPIEITHENSDMYEPVDFSSNVHYEPMFRFYDKNLLEQVDRGNEHTHEFFRLLALCHTVMCEEKDGGRIEYQAQSPDEAALTSAARNFGFVFRSRTPSSITIEVQGEIQVYELLAILDFNNVRKRMSVIIRKDGRIWLYCKGADSVVFERLDPKCAPMKRTTNEHLNRFAGEGLRTLCLAKKEIPEDVFEVFRQKLKSASIALESREDKVNAVYEEIEQNLILIGATAIEDKLQDGVPATIANLLAAGIKVWVLTGDKQETAINIGYSCQLLTDDMSEVFTIESWDFDEVEQELRTCRDTIEKVERRIKRKREAMSHMPAPITFQPPSPASQAGRLSVISHAQSYIPPDMPMHAMLTSSRQSNGLLGLPQPTRVADLNNNYLRAGSVGATDSFDGLQSPALVASLDQATQRTSLANHSQPTYGSTNATKSGDSANATESGDGSFALVINGHSLTHALQPSMQLLLLEVASKCSAVICCRVTPLQKSEVVDLVKKNKSAVTLAIGDGANDVSMIKTAHIGVGISGQEGMQAVLASDFSLAQFRFLERLLLVHGRQSYYRICKFLRYFFYKNFAFTLCHFWYGFFCGFSAQTLFDPAFISFYNVIYTSLPVLALGIFDQDVDDRMSIRYPKLYTPGKSDLLFNKLIFLKSVAHGILTSFVLFFVTYGAFKDAVTPEGTNLDGHQLIGTVVSTILVLVITAQIALDTSYWTMFNHITIWGSIVLYFGCTLLLYTILTTNVYMGSLQMALTTPKFWFTFLLILIILIVPVIAIRFYECSLRPTLSDRVRLKQRMNRLRAAAKANLPPIYPGHRRKSSIRRSRRSVRSGYAFAHQEGFGTLIMSGKLAQKPSMRFGGGISGMAGSSVPAMVGSGSGSFVSTGAASLAGLRPAGYTSSGRNNGPIHGRSLGTSVGHPGSLSSRHPIDDAHWINDESPPPIDYQPPTTSMMTPKLHSPQEDSQSVRQASHESSCHSDHNSKLDDPNSNSNASHLQPEMAQKQSIQKLPVNSSSNDSGVQPHRRPDHHHSNNELNQRRVASRNRKLQTQPSLQPAPVSHKPSSRVYPANTAPSSIDI